MCSSRLASASPNRCNGTRLWTGEIHNGKKYARAGEYTRNVTRLLHWHPVGEAEEIETLSTALESLEQMLDEMLERLHTLETKAGRMNSSKFDP